MDLDGELDFLKQQVDQLTNLLHDYQAKYPPLKDADRSSLLTAVTPPWHVDNRLLSPLLVEYESTITILNTELDKYKKQCKSMQRNVDQLVAENDRLSTELVRAIEGSLLPLESINVNNDTELSALDNVQSQLRCAIQEKDACNDLLRACQSEVQRLEMELRELRTTNISETHWHHLLDQHQQTKIKYTQTITELNQELRLVHDEVRRFKSDAETAERRLNEFKKDIMQSKSNVQLQEKSRIIKIEEKYRHLETELEAKNREVMELRSDCDRLHELVDQQLDQIKRLAKLCGQKEAEIQSTADQIKDAISTAEDAVLQKTEMSLALKNYQTEVDRLREELSVLCDQAGKKTKDEVDKVQSYNDARISKLNDLMHAQENEIGTLKADIERLTREKRTVENELEKVYRVGQEQTYESGGKYDLLCKRACTAEAEKDELKMKLCTLEAELQRAELKMANDKMKLVKENEVLMERLAGLQNDFENVNTDRVKYLEAANSAEEIASAVKKDSEAAARKHNKEIMCLEHSLNLKMSESASKIRILEETHRTALNKLREEIINQQRSANQWKDEYQLLSDKWEKTVKALRAEVTEKDTRVCELTSLLKEARDRTIEVENTLKDYSNQMRKIEMRTKEAEKRASDALTQNALKDRKIKQLIMERQQLMTEQQQNDVPMSMRDISATGINALHSPSVLSEISFNDGNFPQRPRNSTSKHRFDFDIHGSL